jgi:hypothetical protein
MSITVEYERIILTAKSFRNPELDTIVSREREAVNSVFSLGGSPR